MADELKAKVVEKVTAYPLEPQTKEVVSDLILYTLANSMDIKSIFLDKLFDDFSGTEQEEGQPPVQHTSVKSIIDSSIDYCNVIFSLDPFEDLSNKQLEQDIEKVILNFLNEKIPNGSLNKDNYGEFISLLHRSFSRENIIGVIRRRIKYNSELRKELKSVLEYLTFVGREYFEEDELDKLQEAMNFRLNKLKNYSFDYFMTNFFIQQGNVIPMSEKYDGVRYSYPSYFIRDLKNLLLSMESSDKEDKEVEEDAKVLLHKQFNRIQNLQKSLEKLKKQ